MLTELLPALTFAYLLVFARVGAILMVMPGFGEPYISPRVRLVIALALAVIVQPVVGPTLPAVPPQPVELLPLIGGEVLIGVFIGGAMRLLVSALHVAGIVISFQSSLGFAQFFDPAQGSQGALLGSFLTIMGMTLIFMSDMHHLMLAAVTDSYVIFPAATIPPMDDFARMATQAVAGSFLVGIQISAPFIAYALILYIGMGLVNRLMPQMQVFFIVMPMQITLGLLLFMITLGAMGIWFLEHFEEGVMQFIVGG
ncbi:MAG: flagellar biosynthetic protein FliR [Minwuia sp.]|uniref:flagellar biosynthetic protein FliR n=1 Tax=Minwuia sp. TaxID=2493630 RepID=UPI003A862306